MRKIFDNFSTFITSDVEFKEKTNRVLSIVFLFVAFSLTLFTYPSETRIFFIFERPPTNISPGFLSACFSLFLVAPLYARGILTWSRSIYGLLNFVLFLAIFASVAQIALGNNQSDLTKYLLGSAIIISWVGIRAIASTAWILAIAAALLNIVNANVNLGVWGFVFVCALTLGLLLHARLSPAHLMHNIVNEFRSNSMDK